jgi:hypothetical protein
MKINIKLLKECLPQMTYLNKKISSLKNYEDTVAKTTFSIIFSITTLLIIYFQPSVETAKSPVGLFILYYVMSFFCNLVFSMFTSFFTTMFSRKFWGGKFKRKFKEYEKSYNSIYKIKEIKEIINLSDSLPEEVTLHKSIYMNKQNLSEENILSKLLVRYLSKEKEINLELLNEFKKYGKDNLKYKDLDFYLFEIISYFINHFSREDFFKNKNYLIDLILSELSIE